MLLSFYGKRKSIAGQKIMDFWDNGDEGLTGKVFHGKRLMGKEC